MKKFFFLLLSCILILCMTGCDDVAPPSSYDDLPDAYNAETDFPTQFDMRTLMPAVMPAENGYYVKCGSWIYFVDKETLSAQPVCNRPECRHWDETCSAYFNGGSDLFQYYNGKLYIDCTDQDDEGRQTVNLYAFSPDDCTREKICQLPYGLGNGSQYYAIHRGYLYMYSGDADKGKIKLERVALNELAEKSLSPELLYETDAPFAFAPYYLGNHVMFTKWDNDSGQHLNTLVDVNLKTLEANEFLLPNMKEGDNAFVNTVQDHYFIIAKGDGSHPLEEYIYETTYYAYDCQTGEIKELLHFPDRGEKIYSSLQSDGENLMNFYVDLYGTADLSDQSISMLDENGQVLRSIPLDFKIDGACGGDADYSFIGSTAQDPLVLYAIDKRDGKMELKEVLKMPASEAFFY